MAELVIDRNATDDAERQRNRSMLYREPKGAKRSKVGRPAGPQGGGMSKADAARLAAEIADEDAKLTRA